VEAGDEAAADDADAECHAYLLVEPSGPFPRLTCLDYCLSPPGRQPHFGASLPATSEPGIAKRQVAGCATTLRRQLTPKGWEVRLPS